MDVRNQRPVLNTSHPRFRQFEAPGFRPSARRISYLFQSVFSVMVVNSPKVILKNFFRDSSTDLVTIVKRVPPV